MNKKTLIIIAVVIVVGIVAYFGYQKGLFSGGGIKGIIGGIRDDSMMGVMKKQGQIVPSETEFISECKKSDKESQDECYGIGAFYYRDASLCKYIKNPETKSQCTQENIEKMYASGMSGFSGMSDLSSFGGGMVPGGGVTQPGLGTGTGTGTNGETTETQNDLFKETEEVALSSKTSPFFTENVKIEIEKVFSESKVMSYGKYSDYKGSFTAELKVPRVIIPEDLTKLEEVYLKQGFETTTNEVSADSGRLVMSKEGTEIEFQYYSDDQSIKVWYIPAQASD